MLGYLTPDSIPADTICRVLFIPNNEEFIANVTGALEVLTLPESWTEYGLLTPDEAANALVDMFDKFCFNVRGCRMVGEIILWSGTDEPTDDGLLLCDGSLVSSDDYPSLWDIIGTTYGGTGASAFALPDLRGKVAIGANDDHTIADSGGSETVTLSESQMPNHGHSDTGHIHPLAGEFPGLALAPGELPVDVPGSGEVTGIGYAGITNTGGDEAHSNMQPFLTLRYYIQVA